MTALSDILAERARQNEKWGEQNHDDITWVAILAEEVGEAAQGALHEKFGGTAKCRGEVVHVAAVALQWLECIDRQGTTPKGGDTMTAAEIRALRDAATPGPWATGSDGDDQGYDECEVIRLGSTYGDSTVAETRRSEDAALIAAAPVLATLAADALDEVERLRAALTLIAGMPTEELNPDGVDQAAFSMREVAQDALRGDA